MNLFVYGFIVFVCLFFQLQRNIISARKWQWGWPWYVCRRN